MNMHTSVKSIIGFVLLLSMAVAAQNKTISVIKGTVVDKESNEPLTAASVYFAETTIGTTAQAKGEYILNVPKPGNYELVVSMVGYELQKQSLFIEAGQNYSFNFKLVPKPMNLLPVEIEGANQSEWRNCLKIFTRKFMGYTVSEGDCTIENKEYIDFKRMGDTLSAVSLKPIVVVNDYLGYKIVCEIIKYKYDPVSSYQEYSIYSRFIEMTPENKNQKEKWDDNRKEVFFGSPVHFLWSIKHNRIEKEDFKVHLVSKPYEKENENSQELKSIDDYKSVDQFLDEMLFAFKGVLKIEYKNQISYAKLRCPFFTIDSYGIADSHLPFTSYGFWSNYGVASMLPRDYLPDSLKK